MARWSENDLVNLQKRRGGKLTSAAPDPKTAPPSPVAHGKMSPRKMNKTEAAYNDHLWLRRHAGEVAWHDFEAVKLRLADDTYYIPDFIVMLADGSIQIHETKGFMREDASVKLKIAAGHFPFQFILVRKNGDGWILQEV